MSEKYSNHQLSRRQFVKLLSSSMLFSASGLSPISRQLESFSSAPILFTGFEPFWGARDWNSSSVIVNCLKYIYENTKPSISQLHFLSNLPVNNSKPGIAAQTIKNYLEDNFTQGGIVISLGEDPNMNAQIFAARIEHQSQSSAESSPDTPTEQLPLWQLSPLLYQHIMQHIITSQADIFSSNPKLSVQLPFGQDTAGGYICEQTITALNKYSYNQAHSAERKPILPLFIHVPSIEKDEVMRPTLNIILAITRILSNHFYAYKDQPETFVTMHCRHKVE